MSAPTIRIAAIQLEAVVGDLDLNLERCEELALSAIRDGAEWIVLPEFFASGVGNLPALAESAPGPDGAPTQLLRDLGRRHGVHVGGSALVRDPDGEVRNAFFLADPSGEIAGRHDKDLPTMWENVLYTRGADPGRLRCGGIELGVALCWELIRTQTVRRLAGEVELVLSGSGWWSFPQWPPGAITRRLEAANRGRAVRAAEHFAPYVGAPVAHAAHSGTLRCPWLPGFSEYDGHFEGGASVCDADGRVLARRIRSQGPGHAIADVEPGCRTPQPAPERFWLQRRGALEAFGWRYQNPLGRRRYRRRQRRRGSATTGAGRTPGP